MGPKEAKDPENIANRFTVSILHEYTFMSFAHYERLSLIKLDNNF